MKTWVLFVWMAFFRLTPSFAGGPANLEAPRTVTQPAGKNLWRASLVVVAAANAMDAGSSWGKRELNPGLSGSNGKFGGQGAALKLGIVGGVVVLESLILRRQPASKLYHRLAWINLGCASVTGVTAIRNLGIPRQ